MQAVRQFDDDHADILCHGKEHLPQILRLHLQLILGIAELSQLSDAVHEESHFFTELSRNIIQRHFCIFHRVVEHPRHDGLFIHLKVRQDDPHPERMDDIRLPGFPHLVLVSFLSDPICLLYHRDIRRRMVFPHAGDKRLIELLRVLIIFRRFHGMTVHDLQIFIQLYIFRCACHISSPFRFPASCGMPAIVLV